MREFCSPWVFIMLGEFCLLGVERDSGHGEFGGVVLEFGEFASSGLARLSRPSAP